MPAIEIANLAALDELASTGPPASAFEPPASAFEPLVAAPAVDAFAPPAAAFGPPGEADDAEIGVERSTRAIRIENEWKQAQAAAPAAPASPAPQVTRDAPTSRQQHAPLDRMSRGAAADDPKRRASIGGPVLAVALIGLVAAGIAVFLSYPRAPEPRLGAGVSIRIVAHDPTEVMIDGQRAGKTPITLQRPAGPRPILISTQRISTEIIPDHDQTIDVTPR